MKRKVLPSTRDCIRYFSPIPRIGGFCFDRVISVGLPIKNKLLDKGPAAWVESDGKHHLMGGATNSALDDRRLLYGPQYMRAL
jgi:hypothetical protein